MKVQNKEQHCLFHCWSYPTCSLSHLFSKHNAFELDTLHPKYTIWWYCVSHLLERNERDIQDDKAVWSVDELEPSWTNTSPSSEHVEESTWISEIFQPNCEYWNRSQWFTYLNFFGFQVFFLCKLVHVEPKIIALSWLSTGWVPSSHDLISNGVSVVTHSRGIKWGNLNTMFVIRRISITATGSSRKLATNFS